MYSIGKLTATGRWVAEDTRANLPDLGDKPLPEDEYPELAAVADLVCQQTLREIDFQQKLVADETRHPYRVQAIMEMTVRRLQRYSRRANRQIAEEG